MKKKINLVNNRIKLARTTFYKTIIEFLDTNHNTPVPKDNIRLAKEHYNNLIKKHSYLFFFSYKKHLLSEDTDVLIEKLKNCNNNAWHDILHSIKDDDGLFLKASELRREKYPSSQAQVIM